MRLPWDWVGGVYLVSMKRNDAIAMRVTLKRVKNYAVPRLAHLLGYC